MHQESTQTTPNPPANATRLAPSPTGALHLGNARTFLINWALAKEHHWHIIYRVEDLDGARVKPEAISELADTLRWLGIGWDTETPHQSTDLDPCRNAMQQLAQRGLVYPCDLTRAQIQEAASAPHAGEHETHFPTDLRPTIKPRNFDNESTNWRFVTPDRNVNFSDRFAGHQSFNPSKDVGDFIVWTKRAQPAYQLAVTVDDHRHNITHIVRGDDLLPSTARQTLLRQALNLTPDPAHYHLPLVYGPDGRRLAKRHGDTRITSYKAAHNVPPERIIGLIAHWSGVGDHPEPMTALEFATRFDLATMPKESVTFTPEDERWLRSESS